MTTVYGVQPTGFVRKPLGIILAEIEASLITEFGPNVVQTSQSPLGQINGLFADATNELWELAESIYQANDPDQAEGNLLDILGRLRLLTRGAELDEQFRNSITNAGRARIDLQDISRAVLGLDGVTYAQVFSNDTGAIDENGMSPASVAVAVIGGDDAVIAATVRDYVVPGINTYGNTPVNTVIDGFCRTVNIVRPIEVPVTLEVRVRTGKDRFGCPPPSMAAIETGLIDDWATERINGKDVSYFAVRSLIESRFPNVEVVSIEATRDDVANDINAPAVIGFIEIANLVADNVIVIPYTGG